MAEVLIVPGRSRVQQHFGRWRSRWGDMTADSFRRATALDLGSSDTGVLWQEDGDFAVVAPAGYWQLKNGGASPRDTVAAGNYVVGAMPTPSTDAHIRALGHFTTGLPGFLAVQFGIFFRSMDGRSGSYWTYVGNGFAQYGTIDVSTFPATIVLGANVVCPVWAIGETHVLGVDAVGNQEIYSIDGTTLATVAGPSPGPGFGRHGIVAMASVVAPSLITRYRCIAV